MSVIFTTSSRGPDDYSSEPDSPFDVNREDPPESTGTTASREPDEHQFQVMLEDLDQIESMISAFTDPGLFIPSRENPTGRRQIGRVLRSTAGTVKLGQSTTVCPFKFIYHIQVLLIPLRQPLTRFTSIFDSD